MNLYEIDHVTIIKDTHVIRNYTHAHHRYKESGPEKLTYVVRNACKR